MPGTAEKQAIREVLHGASVLVARGGLVQHANALDAAGDKCWPAEKRARAWSPTGALVMAARKVDAYVFLHALYAFARAVGVPAPSDGMEVRRVWILDNRREHNEVCQAIWAWEDAEERTIQDVLAALVQAKKGVSNGPIAP